MANNRIFLETNNVADLIDASRVGHSQSIKLFKYLVLNRYEICISEDMVSTLYYISKDKENTLSFLKNVVFRDWTVLIFGKNVLEKAVEVSLESTLDLEDIMQCLCAKENRCEILVTNDKRFYDCGLSILRVEEFLNKSNK